MRTTATEAFHEGSYVFLNPGDESHNDRHHEQFAEIVRTEDADAPESSHHAGTLQDDPHLSAGAPNGTQLRFSPDKVAATETGHTDAYTKGDD